jgi:hypothetical protein
VSAPTTPPPQYGPNSFSETPHDSPGAMDYQEKARYRSAAARARSAIPAALGDEIGKPIGELVSRELLTVEEFGWTLGAQSLALRLLNAVEKLSTGPNAATASTYRGPTYTAGPKPE